MLFTSHAPPSRASGSPPRARGSRLSREDLLDIQERCRSDATGAADQSHDADDPADRQLDAGGHRVCS